MIILSRCAPLIAGNASVVTHDASEARRSWSGLTVPSEIVAHRSILVPAPAGESKTTRTPLGSTVNSGGVTVSNVVAMIGTVWVLPSANASVRSRSVRPFPQPAGKTVRSNGRFSLAWINPPSQLVLRQPHGDFTATITGWSELF